jgi:NitT/TauT family transport system substrate-binding protein
MNNLRMQLIAMRGAFDLNGGKLWGNATPEAYGQIQNFTQTAGLIPRSIDPAIYMPTIPDFFRKIKRFGRDEVSQVPARSLHT